MDDTLDEPHGPPTREVEMALLKERLKLQGQRLDAGARTFGRMRAAVWAACIASLGSVAGIVYTAGRKDERMEQMAGQIAELRLHAKEEDAEARSLRLLTESLTVQVRAANDRIAAQDELIRALARSRR